MAKSIAIAGAGLMGCLLAWQLNEKGYHVDLYEKETLCHEKQAAMTAAGMLSLYAELPVANLSLFNLGGRSLRLWPEFLRKLDLEYVYNKSGSLVISLHNDHAELMHYTRKIKAINSNANILLQNTKILEKELDRIGCFLEDEATIDTEIFMKQLAYKLRNSDCNLFENIFIDRVEAGKVHFHDKFKEYDVVIDARGVGAGSNFPNLRAVRGELIHVHAPEVNISRAVRVIHGLKMIYIVPRQGNRYIIGASEIEANDESDISVRTCVELLALANAVHFGFSEARILAMKTACRPALNDNLPEIKYGDKMIAVNGLYRHGYLLAPALVEKIVEKIDESYY